MQGDEACDDGNTVGGDYCSADRRRETSICGDGIRQLEEMCDDGNTVTELCDYGVQACTVCTSACEYKAGLVRYCGDGVVQTAFESCDEAPLEGGCDYGPASCFQCTADCAWQEATPRFVATALLTQKRSVTTVIRPRKRVPMAKRAAVFAILCAELRSSMELIAEMVV